MKLKRHIQIPPNSFKGLLLATTVALVVILLVVSGCTPAERMTESLYLSNIYPMNIGSTSYSVEEGYVETGHFDTIYLNGEVLDVFTDDVDGLVPAPGAATGLFLQDDGIWAAPVGSGGDVTAAASLDDNSIIRGDGGAKGVQDSTATIDDTGKLEVAGDAEFDQDAYVDNDLFVLNDLDVTDNTGVGGDLTVDGLIDSPTGRGATVIVAGANASTEVIAQADYTGGTNTAIQNGINALSAGRTWYETVKCIGDFSISTALTPSNYTTLDWTEANIKLANSANTNILSTDTKHDIAIIGGIVDGNKANNSGDRIGLIFVTSYNILIQDTEIKDTCGRGIAGYAVHDLTLKNLYVHDCGEAGGADADGVQLNVNVSNVSVIGGRYIDNYRHGLWITNNGGAGHEASNIMISGVYTEGNGVGGSTGDGIYVNDNTAGLTATEVTITNCIGNANYNESILLIRVLGGTVADSVCNESVAGDGISLSLCESVSLIGNSTSTNAANGIYIVNSSYCAASGNNGRNNSQTASNTYSGILVDNSTYCTLNGNSYTDDQGAGQTQKYGIDEANTVDYNIYTGNQLSSNKTGGLNEYGAHNVAVNNIP